MYVTTVILNGVVFPSYVTTSAVTCSACPSITVICEGEFRDRYCLRCQFFLSPSSDLLRLDFFEQAALGQRDDPRDKGGDLSPLFRYSWTWFCGVHAYFATLGMVVPD